MFSQRLGVVASLALAASAISLPPDITLDSLKEMEISQTARINPYKLVVPVECSRCAVAFGTEGGPFRWENDVPNAFALDFEIGGAHDETLDIDGVSIYPPTFGRFSQPFYVTQVDPRPNSTPVRLRVTGFSFHWSSASTVTETGIELLPLNFKITSIEAEPFDLPAITINVLKYTDGALAIASFEKAKAEESSPIDQDKECKEWPLLCKWKSIMADRIDSMKKQMGKGCHKHNGETQMTEGHHGKPSHKFRPGHHNPHQRPHHHANGHHRHHSHHRFHMFLRRTFFTIVIPILVGIFAGTLTYIIGMGLGYLIAVVVMKVRGYGPYEAVPQDAEDDENDDDDVERMDKKESFVPLPEYDAPPVYEVAAEKEVVSDTN